MIAAILGWTNERTKAHEVYYKTIQKIARTRTLPPYAKLKSIQNYSDSNGRRFDVWWVDIAVDQKVDRYHGYGYRLRERWIRVHPPGDTSVFTLQNKGNLELPVEPQ